MELHDAGGLVASRKAHVPDGGHQGLVALPNKVVSVADNVDSEGLKLLRAHLSLHLHDQDLASSAGHHQRLAQWAQPDLLDG